MIRPSMTSNSSCVNSMVTVSLSVAPRVKLAPARRQDCLNKPVAGDRCNVCLPDRRMLRAIGRECLGAGERRGEQKKHQHSFHDTHFTLDFVPPHRLAVESQLKRSGRRASLGSCSKPPPGS